MAGLVAMLVGSLNCLSSQMFRYFGSCVLFVRFGSPFALAVLPEAAFRARNILIALSFTCFTCSGLLLGKLITVHIVLILDTLFAAVGY